MFLNQLNTELKVKQSREEKLNKSEEKKSSTLKVYSMDINSRVQNFHLNIFKSSPWHGCID